MNLDHAVTVHVRAEGLVLFQFCTMADESGPASAPAPEQGNALDNAAEHYKWAASIGSTREELARLGAPQGPAEVTAGSPAVITPAAGGSAWNNGGTW